MKVLTDEQRHVINQYWGTYVDDWKTPTTILRAMGNLVEDHAQHPLDAFSGWTTGEVMDVAMGYYYSRRFDYAWEHLSPKVASVQTAPLTDLELRKNILFYTYMLRQYLELPNTVPSDRLVTEKEKAIKDYQQELERRYSAGSSLTSDYARMSEQKEKTEAENIATMINDYHK